MIIIAEDLALDLKEVYIHPFEEMEWRGALKLHGHEDCYAHILCKPSANELIYYRGSTECFLVGIQNNPFLKYWVAASIKDEFAQRMAKAVYPLPPSNAPKVLKLSSAIEDILGPTDGYLIFQDQAIAIIRLRFNIKSEFISRYIKNWNLKKISTRELAGWTYISDFTTLEEIIEDRAYDSINYFLYP
jgi:hypothetical protein